MSRWDDQEYADTVIEQVARYEDGWNLKIEGLSMFMPAREGIVPEVGDFLRVYGDGGINRGMVLNGKEVFYMTLEEFHAQARRSLEEYERERAQKRNAGPCCKVCDRPVAAGVKLCEACRQEAEAMLGGKVNDQGIFLGKAV